MNMQQHRKKVNKTETNRDMETHGYSAQGADTALDTFLLDGTAGDQPL